MHAVRSNLEIEYLVDMITHNGFDIKKEDSYSPTDIDALINSSKFMDCEYRCDCGSFIGQDIIGQICPRCHSEISAHALNFQYTGWIDLKGHKIISPIYYHMLKRVIGPNMLKFILGDYKSDKAVQYNENDKDFEDKQKKKRRGKIATNDLSYIKSKIPKSKHIFQGLGHDEFCRRFEEILVACSPKKHQELPILLREKNAVFTSKIPIYSTAFRPVSKTSETMFYPKINKPFSKICSIACQMDDMVLDIEVINALNFIQNDMLEASEHLIKTELNKKTSSVRSEIVGGTFSFSGRSVITLDNSLRADQVDLPYPMVLTAYQYRITHILAHRYNMTLEQAYLYIGDHSEEPIVMGIVDELIAEGQWICYLREPADNLGSIVLAKIRRYKLNDDTLSLPPEVLPPLNADFDGDAIDLFFLPKELIKYFEKFHLSCMSDYITGKIHCELMAWNEICLGVMSE